MDFAWRRNSVGIGGTKFKQNTISVQVNAEILDKIASCDVCVLSVWHSILENLQSLFTFRLNVFIFLDIQCFSQCTSSLLQEFFHLDNVQWILNWNPYFLFSSWSLSMSSVILSHSFSATYLLLTLFSMSLNLY